MFNELKKIVTQGDTSNEGPSGVKLTLIQNNKAIGSTQSGADGRCPIVFYY